MTKDVALIQTMLYWLWVGSMKGHNYWIVKNRLVITLKDSVLNAIPHVMCLHVHTVGAHAGGYMDTS